MRTIVYFLLLVTVSTACQDQNQPTKSEVSSAITYDTASIALIGYNAQFHSAIFENATALELNTNEIEAIDSLLHQCLHHYNESKTESAREFIKEHPELNFNVDNFTIQLDKYKRQYLPVTDANGNKQVWVNCFCFEWENTWQNEIITIKDGGKCYFNLTIDLTKKTYSELFVNGDA